LLKHTLTISKLDLAPKAFYKEDPVYHISNKKAATKPSILKMNMRTRIVGWYSFFVALKATWSWWSTADLLQNASDREQADPRYEVAWGLHIAPNSRIVKATEIPPRNVEAIMMKDMIDRRPIPDNPWPLSEIKNKFKMI